MTPQQRKNLVRKWARTLHIYLSMLGLLMLVFFASTGLMLNHEEWFGYSEPQVTTHQGTIPVDPLKEPNKLAIVERLRKDFGATGALDSFETETDHLNVVFKSPGRESQASINREDGSTEVTIESHGFIGRLVELHRGVDAGRPWRWVIDVSAILFLIIGITGLTLWLAVPKWRPLGLVAITACIAICAIVYFTLVP
ncbi:MAG: PepSY-associated TM helix domain-containing protein [Akkermansiaceae bacterium]|nr:PepSY-associated TM helix domain-containing protein [Akkermansiaceae bacterium]